jgi:hypothetical protein
LAVGVVLAVPLVAVPPAVASPLASHADIHLCQWPTYQLWHWFGEARSSGADMIRVSVDMPCWYENGWGDPEPTRGWGHLEEAMSQARMRHLRVLGVLDLTPKSISRCHDRWHGGPYACPPADMTRYGEMAGEIAHHARGTITHWEILNEPDQAAYFTGTPEDYAHMLRAAYDGIKARVPEAQIVLAGLSRPRPSWMARVFATPGANAAEAFDVAAIHLRGRISRLEGPFRSWRRFLAGYGFDGPLWVTEHGYPGDPEFQYDRGYRGGPRSQAAYLTESVLRLGSAGAKRVFVSLRDSQAASYNAPASPYESEGMTDVRWNMWMDHPLVTRRPAFGAMRRLDRNWGRLSRLIRQRRAAERSDPRRARRLALRIAGPYR